MLALLKNLFTGNNPTSKSESPHLAIKTSEVKRQYQSQPSLSAYLPWLDWSDETHTFLLEDGVSVGCLLELRDFSTESLPEASIEAIHTKLTGALSRLVPLEEFNPWVIQFFIQDDLTLEPLAQKLARYVPPSLRDKPLTQRYLQMMNAHFEALTQEKGLFDDPLSGLPFKGKTRRIRLALYRRYADKKHPPTEDVLDELIGVSESLIANLQAFGMKVRRMKGKAVYEWLVRWFNPRPEMTEGKVDSLLARYPYPKDEEKPFGWSFSQNIFFSTPRSETKGWLFDNLIHRVMVFKEISNLPDIGLISRERAVGDSRYALFDKLPEGAIYTLQITFEAKSALEKHLDKIEKSAVGKGQGPLRVKEAVARARLEVASQHLLFRAVQAIYYRADDESTLAKTERQLMALLSNVGLSVISPQDELNRLDSYLRFLPCNFNPLFDKAYSYRSNYLYASDVAALLPVYGRSRGQGEAPHNIFYNRGGEPFIFDELSPLFKTANAHMAILGSTGAGKSVLLNTQIFQSLAMRGSRVFVIEAGGSFDLLGRYVEQFGVSVNRITFSRSQPIAMNPFAESYKALAQIEAEERAFLTYGGRLQDESEGGAINQIIEVHAKKLQEELQLKVGEDKDRDADREAHKSEASDIIDKADESRDILSEMALALRIMITGGLDKEEERFTLADDMLILETLVETIKHCKKAEIPQVLTIHIIEGFKSASERQTLPDVAKRLDEMARAISGFVKNPLKAQFFNRPSNPLPETDLTIINLGFLQEKQNGAMMSVLFISLLARILALAEANQYSGRPIELYIDEAHIPLKNPLAAVFLILMAKVARKIGLWLRPATQNIEDFATEEAKKMLSMMETWLCLALNKKEVSLIKQFRAVSEEEEALLLDIRKYQGLYSEGVLLGSRFKGLFRNVPPRLMLALAMTEQSEKAERQEIMTREGVDELKAAELIAERLLTQRKKAKEDTGFDD